MGRASGQGKRAGQAGRASGQGKQVEGEGGAHRKVRPSRAASDGGTGLWSRFADRSLEARRQTSSTVCEGRATRIVLYCTERVCRAAVDSCGQQ